MIQTPKENDAFPNLKDSRNLLRKEFRKDFLIKGLKNWKKWNFKIIVGLIIFLLILGFAYIRQSQRMSFLDEQIANQHAMLKDIHNNVNYQDERQRLAKALFRKCAYAFSREYGFKLDIKELNEYADATWLYGEVEKEISMEFWMVLIATEVDFDLDAVSSERAEGAYQLMYLTAKAYSYILGIPWEGRKTMRVPKYNTRMGVEFMCDLMDIQEFKDKPEKYLTAYLWGEMGVKNLCKKGMFKKNLDYYQRFKKKKKEIEKIIGYEIQIKNLN